MYISLSELFAFFKKNSWFDTCVVWQVGPLGDQEDNKGFTPLSWACYNGKASVFISFFTKVSTILSLSFSSFSLSLYFLTLSSLSVSLHTLSISSLPLYFSSYSYSLNSSLYFFTPSSLSYVDMCRGGRGKNDCIKL